MTDLYYTVQWQMIEERVDGVISVQNVFSPVYIDAMILRDRDTDMEEQFDGEYSLGYTFDERLYAHFDANFNVTSLAKDTDPDPADPVWTVGERYLYDPYGQAFVLSDTWSSQNANTNQWQNFHQGLRWEGSVGLYDNRNRFLSPSLGRFNKEDPLGFVDGLNLYQYVRGNPVWMRDPLGLEQSPGWVSGKGYRVGKKVFVQHTYHDSMRLVLTDDDRKIAWNSRYEEYDDGVYDPGPDPGLGPGYVVVAPVPGPLERVHRAGVGGALVATFTTLNPGGVVLGYVGGFIAGVIMELP